MANRFRGDVEAVLSGQRYTLRLTLGALAELETALGAGDLVQLARRFERGALSARDIVIIVACGLRGGGSDLRDEEVARLVIDGGLPAWARLAADLVTATFADEQTGEAAQAFPPGPQSA